MINTLKIYDELKETMEPAAARKIANILGLIYEEVRNTATKQEFNELRKVTQQLAEAQARTEKRIGVLAEAQARTEKRVEELAEAQARTENRVEELAEAQARTEKRVEELAEAQAKTEKAVKNLAQQVGGLSERIGGSLEDLSYDILPACLEKYYQVEVEELGRKSIVLNGREVEFNVFGKGIDKKTGRRLTIIGEVKTNVTLKEVKDFLRLLKMARKSLGEDIFPVLFGFRIRLDARELVKANQIPMFFTYGKELK